MISTRSPRGARALGMLVLAVTFAAGAIAATAVDQVLLADPASRPPAESDDCQEKKQHLLDRLDLSQEQRARIDGILERRRAQTDRFWSDAGPTLNAIMDSTRAEIRSVLTPEQQAEYERLRRERKAARAMEEAREEAGTGR